MPKRKSKSDESKEDSDSDNDSLLNVDFEWFDPAALDYHGLKALLKQLFDCDGQLFNMSELADLIISQPLLGSTVKVEDEEKAAKKNDPFAFLSVINLHTHRDNVAVFVLAKYLEKKAKTAPALEGSELPKLVMQTLGEKGDVQIGLILCERLINMPTEISPPMYRMLLEEIQWAVEANEPYKFTHYLIVSKTYVEVESTLASFDSSDEDETPKKKKQKASKRAAKEGKGQDMLFFHPEDEIFIKHSMAAGGFTYTRENEASSDSKRAFNEAGIKPQGGMYLLEAAKFQAAVEEINQALGAASNEVEATLSKSWAKTS